MSHHSTTIVDVVIWKMRPLLKDIVGKNIELEIRATSTADAVRAAPMDLEQIVTALAVCGRDGLSDGGIIFLSGYSARVVATKDDTAYGRAYLRKPFTVDDLAQKVREVLDANDDHKLV